MKLTPPTLKWTFFSVPSAQTYFAQAAVVPVETPWSAALGLTAAPSPPEQSVSLTSDPSLSCEYVPALTPITVPAEVLRFAAALQALFQAFVL